MDIEDELRRVLNDDNLDIPVRTGAEWSLMAGARRRRQRHNAMAAVGGVLAMVMLAGSGVALVNFQSPEHGVPPAVPPVVDSSQHPKPTGTPAPGQPPNDKEPGGSGNNRDTEDWTDYSETAESEDEQSILRGTDTTSSEPSSDVPSPSSETQSPSDEPGSTTADPPGN